jgi:hypothetical protein
MSLTIQVLQLGAQAHVLVLRHRVGHDHLIDGRSVDAGNGIAAEDAVREQGVDGSGALLLKELGGPGDGVAGVDKIVNKDADAVLDVSNKHHAGVALLAVLGRAALL